MPKDYKTLTASAPEEMPQQFLDYCRQAISSYENGAATIEEAAYAITSAISVREINNNPLFDHILELASALELPDNQPTGSPQAHWVELIAAVKRAEEIIR